MNLGNRNNIATVWTLVLAALIVIGLAVTASFPALAAASGTWSLTGSMNTGREDHTATLLQNGEVLVAGGISAADATLASAELYSPTSCLLYTSRWRSPSSPCRYSVCRSPIVKPNQAATKFHFQFTTCSPGAGCEKFPSLYSSS